MIRVPPQLSRNPDTNQRYQWLIEQVLENRHPFYAGRLTGDLVEAPILTREDILARNDVLLNGHEPTARTSGSTGVPVKIAWTSKRTELEYNSGQKFKKWLGGTPLATMIIHPRDEEDELREDVMDIRRPPDEQVALIRRMFEARGHIGVTSYPTNFEILSRHIIDEGLDMGFVEVIGVYAEVFEPHQEALINKAFPNARVWTTYSSMEFGLIAGRCPYEPDFHHFLHRKVGMEVLNDRNEPAKDGELGRIVATDFCNGRSPLIRYEIGDMAALASCPCGRTDLPALSQLVGKTRGALVHRDGRRIPFTSLSVALRDLPGVRQYQVVQHEVNRFELRVARDTAAMTEADFLSAVENEFEGEFGYVPGIRITPERRIERGANGKFYASISHV